MSKKILYSFALLVIFARIFSSPATVCAGGKDYCNFVNWIRSQQTLKQASSRGTSYVIPASHISQVGWNRFLTLASGEFTEKQIRFFLNELEQLGKIEFDGQQIRFWDNDPDFCPPGGKPAGEESQTNPSGSPNNNPLNIVALIAAIAAILFGISRRRGKGKQAEAYGGD